MTTFVDMEVVSVRAPLQSGHYPFPRAKFLRESLIRCVTDYYTKAASCREFEARGLLVTGKSRVGKTRELQRLVEQLNTSNTLMPDDRPARFVSCTLVGKANWREGGNTVLEALGYPADGRRDAGYIWRMVRRQAKEAGVVGLHIDEAQHMFTDTGEAANRAMLDNFKSLMKDTTWPMMLVLSGVPDLARHIEKDRPTEDRRQLRFLMTPVHFEMINPDEDIEEINTLAYSYADKAGVNFDGLSEPDFLERLIHGCAYRWGLVIEMLIEAFTISAMAGGKVATREHFVKAFAQIYGLPEGYSPFTLPDFRESVDPEKLMEMLDRDR
ncbi:ATP-binding protein [Pseudogemmobacter bohemicus]|uniref:ATP-binding protein n=1 Tax=Pseudogemmobacter bohemicus TaxID=2250708 RepID=UPI000DD48D5A|nr:ATP-binding protein [Pseudogemmobacter bohemicus]